MSWSIVYRKAIEDDGTLLFPERLSKEFLEIQKRKLGSYAWSNQYQNEIISEENQTFKKNWLQNYKELPTNKHTFAMIDPAIGQNKTSDYTGIVVIDVDTDGNWYVRLAKRERCTPTQIVNLVFSLNDEYQPRVIGVESVAYQKALIYLISEEMGKRKKVIPLKEILRPTDKKKETRIRGPLVPRYEWKRIFHAQGLYDLENELLQFPKSSHDDLIDALASMDEFVTYPEAEKEQEYERPNSPADPKYESWFRQNLRKNKNQAQD